MKVKGEIKILDETRSGVNQSTGNPWQCKCCVICVEEEGMHGSTLACKTFSTEVIEKLNALKVGDTLEFDVRFHTNGRPVTYRDGKQGYERWNEVTIVSVEEIAF